MMSNVRKQLKQRLARELKTRPLHVAMSDETLLAALAKDYSEVGGEIASWASVGAKSEAAASIAVPLLLDFTCTDGSQRGDVVSLTLVLIPVKAPEQWQGWVCDPSCANVQIDSEFKASLEGTRQRLHSLDPAHSLWPENADFHIRWAIPPEAGVGKLSGRSADCIITLAVIELLRKARRISSDHALWCHIETWTPASWRGLSASVQVDEHGIVRPVPAEPLRRKLASAHKAQVETVLVNLPRGQSHVSTARASSSPELVQITSLQDAVFYLASRGRPTPAVRRRAVRALWVILLGVAFVVGAIYWLFGIAYPFTPVLRMQFPMAAIDQAPIPTNCNHVIAIPKLTKEVWKKQVWPKLKGIQSPYALVIGRPGAVPNDADQFALDGLDELQSLRSLALFGVGVNELPGLDQLTNLEQLVISNSCVKSAMSATDLPRLRVLVLDSPWIQALPKKWRLPQAEVIVIHTNSSNDSIAIQCPRLQTLTVCSEYLEWLWIPENLTIQELIVATPRMKHWFQEKPVPSLRKLTLVEFSSRASDEMENYLDVYPGLEELNIKGGTLNRLTGLANLSKLRKLHVSGTPELRLKGIEQLSGLTELSLENVPKVHLANMASFTSLQYLEILLCDLSSITGLDHLRSAIKIRLHAMPKLPQLIESIDSEDQLPLTMSALPSLSGLKKLEDLDVSCENITTVPPLALTKPCIVNFHHEELRDGRDGSIIKQHEDDALVWHPSQDGRGYFESLGLDLRYGQTLYSSGPKFRIDGSLFGLHYHDNPEWMPMRSAASYSSDFNLHCSHNWKKMLDRLNIKVGCNFPK